MIPQVIRRQLTRSWDKIPKMETKRLIEKIASQNVKNKSYIGRGFHPTRTPEFLIRNVLENPKWFTAYTPYQAEISQGRLEALFNFQTMICDLTQMDVSNASLLDEATATAEAMFLLYTYHRGKKSIFLVDEHLHPQNHSVLAQKAKCLNIELKSLQQIDIDSSLDNLAFDLENVAGIIFQNPDTRGDLWGDNPKSQLIKSLQTQAEIPVVEVSDLLSCVLFKPPGENDFDISVGSTQRLGLPMWFGGPHAGFMAAKAKYLRLLPARIVGESRDTLGDTAYRLCLQTREQHIRKEKATSNICTAQALLANLSTFYVMYQGSQGITDLATNIHRRALNLKYQIANSELYQTDQQDMFDGVRVPLSKSTTRYPYNFEFNWVNPHEALFSMNELVVESDLIEICNFLNLPYYPPSKEDTKFIRTRKSPVLKNAVFNQYSGDENSMIRHLNQLVDQDYSLVHGMIPLGSCTMKLNPSHTLTGLTLPGMDLHPYTHLENSTGYYQLLRDLEEKLKLLTGMDAISFQPNAGSQGEYAGLLAIKEYLDDPTRNICIIPDSAHGTNFASAKLAGFDIKVLKTYRGRILTEDLHKLLQKYPDQIGAFMVTYPSTYGVFDDNVVELIDLIHQFGGQVYLDGANLNALLGQTSPGEIGADVCHLNLHKTFAIPHGGGGPGMGPIGVKKHLRNHLPNLIRPNISGSPYGSASILSITWLYLLNKSTEDLIEISTKAIENANYLKQKLESVYAILYQDDNGQVAHEFIIDCQEFSEKAGGIREVDIAKRLIDYGFHPPTLSWPVPNSLMIEPTETETVEELDRFVEAMLQIRQEIDECPDVLKNAPHSLSLLRHEWKFPYSTKLAFYPTGSKRTRTYFPAVNRVDEIYGDRNPKITRS